MKRKGIHKPTIEDIVEISGIETLHPGGFALTRRTAEVASLRTGIKVLDVSCGRGTQAIFYAQEYGAEVIGVDIAEEMIATATERAKDADIFGQVSFVLGDSQNLPFDDDEFDVVINECAVGIPDDSQRVLNEMVRVAKPGGSIVIHESIWLTDISKEEKYDLADRYGTTPLLPEEWSNMMKRAGVQNLTLESEEWSKPEHFWKIRKERDVEHYSNVLTPQEKAKASIRIIQKFGMSGLFKAFENERAFYQAVLDRKLGYGLYHGTKESSSSQ